MNNKLEVLRERTGEDFVQIDAQNFKSDKADAIVLEEKKELPEFLKDRVKEEIPYLKNEILKNFLPEKFHNDFILDEYKELCKFDHTLLSNLIKDELGLTYAVMGQNQYADLVCIDSTPLFSKGYWIFYLPHELN